MKEDFEDVELTDDEINALKKAKLARLKEQKYFDELNKTREPLLYSAESFYSLILLKAQDKLKNPRYPDRPSTFKNDEWCKQIFTLLSLYFTNDIRFEKNGTYSLDKGILIMGNVGCGKTFALEMFLDNQKCAFVKCEAETCADNYKNDGEKALIKYYDKMTPAFAMNSFGHTSYGILFDDLGVEDPKKHFGNEMTVMAKIIRERHKRKLFSQTFMTTNLNAKEIEERYGTRTRSRMREMFNIIKFADKAPDRRK